MNAGTKNLIIKMLRNNLNLAYDVKERTDKYSDGEIKGLNSTVNGHPNYGVFFIRKSQEKHSFFIVFTTYNDDRKYRMHIFSKNGRESLGEFHIHQRHNDTRFVFLKYKPTKRDGMNPKRKELFEEEYGSLEAKIHIQPDGKFLDDLFHYAICRSIVNALLKPEIKKGTEINATVKQRVGQYILRKELLKIYSGRCAMCDIDERQLLRASHIIPWSEEKKTRLDLRNAILLCGLHDLAFEHGHITILPSCLIRFNQNTSSNTLCLLKKITSKKLRLPSPEEFKPKKEFLSRHRRRHEIS